MKELSELQLQKRELRLSKRVDRQNLTTGTPWKKILMFSIPILIGCLFQQLYSMVDAIIVGKYLGSDALAAVGTTGPISFLVIGFAQGITSGMAVITSQKFGDKNNDKVKKSIATSTMLSVGIIIVLTTIAILTARPLLKLMRVPSQLMDMADTYISIIYWGIFSAIFYNLASSQLRAIGDS
ncbi:MAG: MATE family efflux transporter, partial [Clostridia bacterium]